MKQKVINVVYRKDSNSFPEWLKYEITLLNEDGTEETIPAYGKDLQDALSRVVHDQKAVQLSRRVQRIPEIIWVVLWFGYIIGWMQLTYRVSEEGQFDALFFTGGMVGITAITLYTAYWMRLRNRRRAEIE